VTVAGTQPAVNVPGVRLRGLRKEFGQVVAVDHVDLDVAAGEFFAMLGPSGSGKTTVLRMIAGFEEPTAGTVHLGRHDVTRQPPFRRDVNTVFQDYALFPHMNVAENVEYGLRVHGIGKAERRTRAGEALTLVRLDGYGSRKPSQLSGGQRQRVALARALVNRPKVLLLDEPLGALDLKLGEQMQLELKAIQREVCVTFMFVTHDQDEALTLSDRIAVFNAGPIEQLGTPREVYEQPASAFVAGFVGTSNVLSGSSAQAVYGRLGTFAIRPERVRVADDTINPGDIEATGGVSDSVRAGLGATAVALVLGTMAAFAVQRYDFFGRSTISFLVILPIALPGIVTGIALNAAFRTVLDPLGIGFGLTTVIIGHATFCIVVVYNNVLARLRRLSGSLEEASADLGATGWQTFRLVTFPMLRTALVAGGLLAFGLSFDEIVVTTFTSSPDVQTLPLWIFGNLFRPNQAPVVNVVAAVLIVLAVLPVWLSQRLGDDAGSGRI